MSKLRKSWAVVCGSMLLACCGLLASCGEQETPDRAAGAPGTEGLKPAASEASAAATAALDAIREDDSSQAKPPGQFLGEARPSTVVTQTQFVSSGNAKSVTFDDIKFDMKKDERFRKRMFTDKITGLFDKNIKIRGYILPSFKESGITTFVLVRDNMECCFGPGAALYDCIIVDMVEGKSTKYTVRPVTVEGRFSYQKLEDPINGELRAIYHLDGVDVQ